MDLPPPSGPLPRFAVDAAPLPARERFDAWRSLLPGYALSLPPGPPPADGFGFAATAWALGSARVVAGRKAACHGARTAALLRRDGEDSYAVHLMLNGGWRGTFGGRAVAVEPGQPVLVDYARETDALADGCDFVSLELPRGMLDAALPPGAARHGAVLGGAAGAMLAAHLRALADALPVIGTAEAPFLASAARDLLAACLVPDGERSERAAAPLRTALLARARRHVERTLRQGGDPSGRALSPAALQRALGVSRSVLYRAFEPVGGVVAQVRAQRLAEAYRRLRDPAGARAIAAVAAELGFADTANFSRAFRHAYGASPREIRAAAPGGPDRAEPEADYQAWRRRHA